MKIRKNSGDISDDMIDKRAETRAAGGSRGLAIPGGAKGGIGGIVILLAMALLGGSQVLGGGSGDASGGLGDILGQVAGAQPAGPLSTAVPGAPDPDAETVEWGKAPSPPAPLPTRASRAREDGVV